MSFRDRNLLFVSILWVLLHQSLYGDSSDEPEAIEDYCLHEVFQPRCLKNEVILMKTATYGRMRIGRCISSKGIEALGPIVGQDPRYLGCFVDVLHILDGKCSGTSECDIRVADLSLENVMPPCFPDLMVYLEVSYGCINVADEERSCVVTASVVPTHIIGSTVGSQRICGTYFQPWTVEAPIGQKIRISLIDFNAFKSDQVAKQSKRLCHSYGVMMDKGSKRNVSICGDEVQREKYLYMSTGNVLEIYVNLEDKKENIFHAKRFILRVEAVGCLDLIPPEDAWLKRNDDSIVLGCYSSRKTWHLHCEGEKWIGVFGNCSQAHEKVVELVQMDESWNDDQVLHVVAVGGFTLIVCLAVLCAGILGLRRYSAKSKKRRDYRTLNFQINSASSQHANQQLQSSAVSDSTGNDRPTHEIPTYSVFVGESDFNVVDNNSTSYNDANPCARL